MYLAHFELVIFIILLNNMLFYSYYGAVLIVNIYETGNIEIIYAFFILLLLIFFKEEIVQIFQNNFVDLIIVISLRLICDRNIFNCLRIVIDINVNLAPFLKNNMIIWLDDKFSINKYSLVEAVWFLSAHLTFVYITFMY